MEFSEFTFRIILLFLPGIISFLIIENLTVSKEKPIFYFAVYTLVLGFYAYFTFKLVLILSHYLLNRPPNTDVHFLDALLDRNNSIDFSEIFYVSILSILNGFLLSFVINKKWLHRLAQGFTITTKFAELDVWDFVFNSSYPTEWVTVRDIKNDLAYEGWVEAFSDTVKESELFIRDVVVFKNSTGEKLYETPGLYIARNRDEITIEFNSLDFTESFQPE